ncbi:uncharacterized protein LOC126803565 [Argentina anserina]|uniref:uncharacterized protein LOC126803565 n=1 Tax=Argentina anserina TaxID=57926 RepID=UPI00217662B5|nr:uncharacterized protein LOC126803565 [Potentilla anserina]
MTDNIATSYFQTQKKLSPKQARWQDFLAEFDYTIEYKPEKANVVADALSRKAEFASISQFTSPLLSKIKEGLRVDPQAQSLITLVKEGKTRRFWLDDDLLYTRGRHIYVPKMRDGVEEYVSTCLVCQEEKSEEFGSIIVVVDRFSKYATFMAASADYTVEQSEATNKSHFKIVLGQQPTTPISLVTRYEWNSSTTFKFAKSWHEQIELARAALHKAAKRMKKWANKKRRHVEFKEGDLVLVKLLPQQFKAFRKVHKGLIRRYEGSFEVIKRVGKVSYKFNLPPKLKIHLVFHVSMLKPYNEDEEDPSRGISHRAHTSVVTNSDKEVDKVLVDRVIRRQGVPSYKEYLIKWRGMPNTKVNWESEDTLGQFKDKIQQYNEAR